MVSNALSTRRQQAVYNNAVWCDTVCQAHGIPGEFLTPIWLSRNRVPRHYPNAVTLTSDHAGIAEQMDAIRGLMDGGLRAFAVKDSYQSLDLTPLGFHPLFDAIWLWREPNLAVPPSPGKVRFAIVRQADELAAWERVWADLPDDQPLTLEARIFPLSLLANRDVRFIAAYQDGRIVGGAIGNRTGGVVGLSNQFAPSGESLGYWAGFVAALTEAFPQYPLVGYERGDDLEVARALSFEDVGPLRVWAR